MDTVANCFSTIDLHLKAAVWRKLMTDLLHPQTGRWSISMSNAWVSTEVMMEEKWLLPPLLCLPSLYRHSPWGVGFALSNTSQNVHIPFIWCIQSGAYAHLCLAQHPCCRYMATLWQGTAAISWEARLLLPPTRLDFRADNVATSRLVKPTLQAATLSPTWVGMTHSNPKRKK